MDGLDAQTEYVLEYRHGGHAWATHFFAVDDADAQAKVESVRESLVLKGRLMGRGDTLDAAWQAAAKTACDDVIDRLGCSRASPKPRQLGS